MGRSMVFSFIILCSLFINVHPLELEAKPGCFKKIYSFGDSLTDTGNAVTSSKLIFSQIHSPPYGQTFFHYPTGRSSDGRLLLDFLTKALVSSSLPPYLTLNGLPVSYKQNGVNFAVAGATALDPSFMMERLMFPRTPLSLDVQIGWFQNLKNSACIQDHECQVHDFSKALYVMGEIGASEYLDSTFTTVPWEEIESLTPLIIAKIHTALQVLIKEGAQYIFLQGMPPLPPLGCLPSILTLRGSLDATDYDENRCIKLYNQLSQNHNKLLQNTLQQLKIQYPQVTLVYGDYYNITLEILRNHAAYGFKDTIFHSCCGDGGGPYNFNPLAQCGTRGVIACSNSTTSINWDGIHFTEAAHRIASQLILNQPDYTQPPFRDLLDKSCNHDLVKCHMRCLG